jgi:hypothetical protein
MRAAYAPLPTALVLTADDRAPLCASDLAGVDRGQADRDADAREWAAGQLAAGHPVYHCAGRGHPAVECRSLAAWDAATACVRRRVVASAVQ